MADRQEIRASIARWQYLGVVGIVALLSAAASYAAEASPFMLITRWQQEKLRDTEFATHAIQKRGEQYFLVRSIRSGELFERLVDAYCNGAGIDAEHCKEVTTVAQAQHDEKHWHKNFQVNDTVFLRVPPEVYEPKSPAPGK
jgi:hypothetical protein